jgi:hypothetical protein
MDEPIEIPEREQFIKAWQEEVDYAIQQVFPVPDEILFGFLRYWFPYNVGLYYDNLLGQQSKTREQYLAGLKSIGELSYLEQAMASALIEYLKQYPEYDDSNIGLQITHFGLFLLDRALEFDPSPVEDKLDMLRARRLALQNKIAIKQDSEPFMKTAKPILDYVNNHIAEFERMIAEKKDEKNARINTGVRATWRKDDFMLQLLLKSMSTRGFSPDIRSIEKVFRGDSVAIKIEFQWLNHFIWLLHELKAHNCYVTSPNRGYLSVFEKAMDWDYCNSPTIVPFKKIASAINTEASDKHHVKSIVTAILKEAKVIL